MSFLICWIDGGLDLVLLLVLLEIVALGSVASALFSCSNRASKNAVDASEPSSRGADSSLLSSSSQSTWVLPPEDDKVPELSLLDRKEGSWGMEPSSAILGMDIVESRWDR